MVELDKMTQTRTSLNKFIYDNKISESVLKERTDNVPRHIFHCMILIAISTGNSELSEHYHNYERFTNMLPIEKLVLITAIAAIGDTTSEAEIDGNLLDLLLGGLILKQLAKDLKGLK